MNTFWQGSYQKIFLSGSKLYLLIAINVVVFLAINVPAIFEQLIAQSDHVKAYSIDYLALPAYLPKLLTRFWTPLTYMFMHSGVFHILFNMLWLYWMGQIFEDFLGYKKITGLYLMGGLAGALMYILCFNVFPAFSNSLMFASAVGASASVMAVMVATATIVPHYTISLMFIGPVKLKWLVLVYVVLDLFGVTGSNAGGAIAHLGGALLGFVYIKQLQSGNDWIAAITGLFKKRSKLKVVANDRSKTATGKPRQEDIDQILDKISVNGYDNLSKQEKEILFRASNNNER